MSWNLTILASACFLSFGWALQGHFRSDGRMPPFMRLLSLLSLAAAGDFGVSLWTGSTGRDASLLATVLFASSFALFWWAISATRRRRLLLAHSATGPDRLHVTGPYALVRHPFYSSYILFWTGTAVAAGPAQWPPAAILVAWYVITARREEHRLAALTLPYAAYRRRTGMLVPRLGAFSAVLGRPAQARTAEAELSTSVR